MSLRAYARRRGVSAESVSKAIEAGRLRETVVIVGGQPKIADAEIADREWAANTRPRVDRPAPPEREDAAAAAAIPEYNVSRAVREHHAARREGALADMAELEVAEKLGKVVDVEEARRDIIEKFTIVKTKLLGVPSRVAQRLPHLAAEVVPVVDALLRETLEELAAGPGDDEEVEA